MAFGGVDTRDAKHIAKSSPSKVSPDASEGTAPQPQQQTVNTSQSDSGASQQSSAAYDAMLQASSTNSMPTPPITVKNSTFSQRQQQALANDDSQDFSVDVQALQDGSMSVSQFNEAWTQSQANQVQVDSDLYQTATPGVLKNQDANQCYYDQQFLNTLVQDNTQGDQGQLSNDQAEAQSVMQNKNAAMGVKRAAENDLNQQISADNTQLYQDQAQYKTDYKATTTIGPENNVLTIDGKVVGTDAEWTNGIAPNFDQASLANDTKTLLQQPGANVGQILFPDDVVDQRGYGDCFLMASLGAVMNSPGGFQKVRNMVTYNPPDPNNPNSDNFTVSFPKSSDFPEGKMVTVHWSDIKDPNGTVANGAGVPIIEAAYAKALGETKQQAYAIGGWPKDALDTLTGKNVSQVGSIGDNLPDVGGAETAYQQVASGKVSATVGFLVSPGSDFPNDLYGNAPVTQHAYIMEVDPNTGNVILLNPWDSANDSGAAGSALVYDKNTFIQNFGSGAAIINYVSNS